VSDLARDPRTFLDNQFVHEGRVIGVDALVASPRLAVLSGLLSTAECEALIAAASALMTPSLVIDDRNVGNTADDTRTSSGMHFPLGASTVADEIQRRIMSVIGLPIDRAEPLQVLRYGPGEEYVPHFDFFDVDESTGTMGDERATTVSRFGQRVATMICYLSAVESGGATVFPEIGLEVRPLPGRAVYFTYLDEDGVLDYRSLHGGAPVDAGEKWIVTQWCRQRPYRAAGAASWGPPTDSPCIGTQPPSFPSSKQDSPGTA
jgi:prolyl 4-hydroxylase